MTMPDLPAGHIVTAAELEMITDASTGVQQAVWTLLRNPSVETTLLVSFTTEATLYTTPSAITVLPSAAYWLEASIPVVSYSGANFEFSVAAYDGATVLAKSGSVMIQTSGSFTTARISGLFTTGSGVTTITPVYKALKLAGAGNGDVRASAVNPLSIRITSLGIGSSAVNI